MPSLRETEVASITASQVDGLVKEEATLGEGADPQSPIRKAYVA